MRGSLANRGAALLDLAELERYADAIVRECVDLAEGETMLVDAAPAHRDLAVAIAESAYRAGARLADIHYSEARAQGARLRLVDEGQLGVVTDWEVTRFRAQTRPDVALVTVMAESDAGAFDGVEPERLAIAHRRSVERLRGVRSAFRHGRRRWCGVSWPTPLWASRAYPELDPLVGQHRLAEDILRFCRLGPDDPPGFEGWRTHTAALGERSRALTELGLLALEVRGPGTELYLRLAPGTRWLGGPRENGYGRVVTPNFPTEENFTSPHPSATEGTFRCSRPLAFRGRVIERIAGELRGGRLVRLEAAREQDRDLLAAYLRAQPNGDRLGEIALVDRTSRIGRTGRIYVNTLLDENAAAHIAFGSGFENTRIPGQATSRVNRSTVHLDLMIGTPDLEATGVTEDGRRVPLLREGLWQL